MPFLKRLGFFLFGLAIGLIFLAVFLKNKTEETGVEFCYLPNCRVLKDLRSKPMGFDPRISEMLSNKELDTAQLKNFFIDGDVLFNSSDTQAKPCKMYLIEGEIEHETVVVEVKSCPEKVIVVGLR
jgi:hypothetical protein